MKIEKWKTQYEQLNQRSRWYSTQLWAVPFTYLGLTGYGFGKIVSFENSNMKSIGFFVMGIFSLAVFVHVSSIKYYERKAVNNMRALEQPSSWSSGGSVWYMDYSWYIRALLLILSFFFIIIAVLTIKLSSQFQISLIILSLIVLIILYTFIILNNHCRNKVLKDRIKSQSRYRFFHKR